MKYLKFPLNHVIFLFIFILILFIPLDFGGRSLKASIFLIIVTFSIFSIFIISKYRSFVKADNTVILFILFLLLSLISTLFSPSVYISICRWCDLASYFIIFFLIINILDSDNRLRLLAVNSVYFCGLCVVITGYYFYSLTNSFDIESSFYSTFYQQDVYAGFILMLIPIGIIRSVYSENRLHAFFYGLTSVLMVTSLVLSHSRAGWIVFAFQIILLGAMFFRKINKGILIKLSVIILLTVISVSYFDGLKKMHKTVPSLESEIKSLAEVGDTSLKARWCFYGAGLRMFIDHPLTGIGLENFGNYYPRYVRDGRFYSKYAHNLFIQMADETGIFSVIAFICIFVSLFIYGLKNFKQTCGDDKVLIAALIAGISASVLHSFADVDWEFNSIGLYCFFLAGILNSYNKEFKKINITKPAVFVVVISFMISLLFLYGYIGEYFYSKAKHKELMKDFSESSIYYRKAICFNPFEEKYRKDLANLFYFDPNAVSINESIRQSRIIIFLNREKPVLYQLIARLCLNKKDYNDFLKHINTAISKDPVNYPSFYNDLAYYYYTNKDLKSSEDTYKKAISLFPEHVFSNLLDFRKISVNKQLSESYQGLGNVYNAVGKNKEAYECFKKSLTLDKGNYSNYFYIGSTLIMLGDIKNAEIALKEFIYKNPRNLESYDLLRYCMHRRSAMKEYEVFKSIYLDQERSR